MPKGKKAASENLYQQRMKRKQELEEILRKANAQDEEDRKKQAEKYAKLMVQLGFTDLDDDMVERALRGVIGSLKTPGLSGSVRSGSTAPTPFKGTVMNADRPVVLEEVPDMTTVDETAA